MYSGYRVTDRNSSIYKEVIENLKCPKDDSKTQNEWVYGQCVIKGHYFLTKIIFELPVSDQIGVYEFTNSRGHKYTLYFPYVDMMVPKVLETFLKFFDTMWECYNVKVRINESVRSIEYQQQYIKTSKCNVSPQNSPNITTHNLGVQVDITPIIVYEKNGKELWVNSSTDHPVWTILAIEQNKLGLRSGFDFCTFEDRVHYDIPKGYDLQSILNNTWDVHQSEIKNINNILQMMSTDNTVKDLKQQIFTKYPTTYDPPCKSRRMEMQNISYDWLLNNKHYCSLSYEPSTSNNTPSPTPPSTPNPTPPSTPSPTIPFKQDTTINVTIKTASTISTPPVTQKFTSINHFTRLINSIDNFNK